MKMEKLVGEKTKEEQLKKKVMNEVLEEIKESRKNSASEEEPEPDKKEEKKDIDEDIKENIKEEKEDIKEDQSENNEESKNDDSEDKIALIPYVDPSVDNYKKKKKRHKKALLIALISLCAIYFAGVIYCANFFVGKSDINGIDVSYKSVKEADKLVQSDADLYALTAYFRDGSTKLYPEDIEARIELKESIKDVKKNQNPFMWFVYFFEDSKYDVGYKCVYDENKLGLYINGLSYLDKNNMIEPENAYVRLEDGEAKLIEDTKGTVLDEAAVLNAFESALNNFETEVDIDKAGCYETAAITTESESIKNTLKNAEEYLDIEAKYNFAGYIYQIPKEDLTTMAYIDGNGNVSISETNVKLYAQRFAEQFTTYHKDREFYTHDGKHILVSGGYYGWEIDAEAEGEELYDYIVKKRDFVKEPVCTITGYTLCDLNDIGDNYVEIDLTDQHVYIIRDGKVVYDSLCVSGNESRGMGTPGGVYPITYTQQHAILRGPGYETPVAYWMPFNGGIGMHDATWKSKFGEDYYKYDGSHGCINLPLEAAAEIFELVEKDMPVVCYWEDEVTYLN